MDAERWDLLLDINLSSEERINDALLERDLLRPNGRLIGVSSMTGSPATPARPTTRPRRPG